MQHRRKFIRSLPPPHRLPKRGGDHEAEAIARQDCTLSKALTRSRRLGNLLLKQEDEELRQISGLADELIQREYRCGGGGGRLGRAPGVGVFRGGQGGCGVGRCAAGVGAAGHSHGRGRSEAGKAFSLWGARRGARAVCFTVRGGAQAVAALPF